MDPKVLTALSSLVRQQRTLALGSIRDGGPQVTLAAYAVRTDFQAFYLFLSRLARHTRAIEEDNQVGFMIAEPDSGVGDPQTLQRLSLQGTVVRVDPRDDDAEIARSLPRAIPGRSPTPPTRRLLVLPHHPHEGTVRGRVRAGLQRRRIGPVASSGKLVAEATSRAAESS